MMVIPATWIILVNYNGSEDTVDCINSLKAMRMENVKILIVDNGSEQNDRDHISSILDEQIEGMFLSENLGFGAANNKGASYAISKGAEYLLLLNNDTIVDHSLLRILHNYADRRSVLVPSIYYYDYPSELWYAGGVLSRWKGTSVHRTKAQPQGVVEFATGCCVFLHRDIVEKYGLFDENYFMYYEDTDFSIKMQLNQIPICYIPAAKVWHKVGRSSQKISGFQEYYIQRNRLYIINKYHDFFHWYISLVYFVCTRIVMILSHIIKGKSIKHILKGIVDFRKNRMGEQDIC